eukprot:101430_1
MSFSQVRLQVLTNRFVNECDEETDILILKRMYQTFKKHNQLSKWKMNLFNFICNSTSNEIIIDELINILSDLNINDSLSHRGPSDKLMTKTNNSDFSIFHLSTDTLMHCMQFLRLQDLLSLQKCCRYFLIECHRPNALYYLNWQSDRYFASQNLSHHRFSQIQKLQLTSRSADNETLLPTSNDIISNINVGWFGFVKHLQINAMDDNYSDDVDMNQFQELCNKLSVFYNVSKLIYRNNRLDKSLTYNLTHFINPTNIQYLELSSVIFDAKLTSNILLCKNLETLVLADIGISRSQYQQHYLSSGNQNVVLSKLKTLIVGSIDDLEHQLDDQLFCIAYYSFIGKFILNSDHK